MTPTQAELQAAQEQWERDNMFAPPYSQLASVRALARLSRAQVECWKAGECCGCRGVNGRCQSRSVEISRHAQMYDAGMPRNERNELSELCEHSPEYIEAVSWLVDSDTDAGAVLAGRIWALRFLEYVEGLNNVNGNCSGRQEEEKGTGTGGGAVG